MLAVECWHNGRMDVFSYGRKTLIWRGFLASGKRQNNQNENGMILLKMLLQYGGVKVASGVKDLFLCWRNAV